MYNAYQQKLNEFDNWFQKSNLRTFIKLDGYIYNNLMFGFKIQRVDIIVMNSYWKQLKLI